jgi:hypothetical protein
MQPIIKAWREDDSRYHRDKKKALGALIAAGEPVGLGQNEEKSLSLLMEVNFNPGGRKHQVYNYYTKS